jgi:hypothetical protein
MEDKNDKEEITMTPVTPVIEKNVAEKTVTLTGKNLGVDFFFYLTINLNRQLVTNITLNLHFSY